MMEQVNPNVDARDVVGPRIMGAKLRMMIEWDPVRTAAMQLWGSFRWCTKYGLEHGKGFLNEVLTSNSCTSMCFRYGNTVKDLLSVELALYLFQYVRRSTRHQST